MDRRSGVVREMVATGVRVVAEVTTPNLTMPDLKVGGLAPHPVLVGWYATETDRAGFVRSLFDRGAAGYDRIDRLFSLGTGTRYRAALLRRAGVRSHDRVLDVATGTGLVARAARRLAPDGLVVGLDVSAGMLAVARRQPGVALLQARAEQVPARDGAFDVVTMGYALRHLDDLDRAFAEFRRVLRPGGMLLLTEIVCPASRLGQALARLYLGGLVPCLSRLLGGGADASRMMRYYWTTIDQCVPEASIVAVLGRCGFGTVRSETELGLFRTMIATADA
ncbi:class I SAM-dependent methyltransferase [Lichenicoccus sp.]|uniref:class I SAM-dependent methyltransferase n=1 Tax=Lichenicoccus sp. TaxID=2781899 RepID=UPI003D0F4C6F